MRKASLVMCFLLVALSSSLVGSDGEFPRWYAEILLLQPRDATSAGVHIYVYDNNLSGSDAFVAFRICILRLDAQWQMLEWLEVGYFEDHTGFWIYSASFLVGKGYNEVLWSGLAGEGSNGESYLDFELAQVHGEASTFRAYMYDPVMGVWSRMEVTFTIGGDNLWLVGSESNDPLNTLDGHYASIWYGKNGNLYSWSDITTSEDVPYHVLTVSSNEFFTYSGYRLYPVSGGTGGSVAPRKK